MTFHLLFRIICTGLFFVQFIFVLFEKLFMFFLESVCIIGIFQRCLELHVSMTNPRNILATKSKQQKY